MTHTILIVDDEKLIRWSLSERLKKEGYQIIEAADGAEAGRHINQGAFDLALLDLRLPDTDGISLLKSIHAKRSYLPVMIITAYSSIDGAVDAMKCGAVDYITKPFNLQQLVAAVKRALAQSARRHPSPNAATATKTRFGLDNIIGNSRKIEEIRSLIQRVARSESASVLLLGESGSGKDMVARAIHYESARVDNPFMNITCTALPESLLESELFGYEKGAFTDAKLQKKGLFEYADGGTVFLDEIGDMWPGLQAKLLRVLEEKSFKRVGGNVDIKVNVRMIAATNRDIDAAIRQGRFREDLYYRLSTVPIVLPPLRTRREDIPLLANHFVAMYSEELYSEELGGGFKRFAPDAMEKLLQYAWPGNVRELRNAVERAVLLSGAETIESGEVILGRSGMAPTPVAHSVLLPEEGCNIEEVERDLIQQALLRTNGNQTHAATLVGITRDQIRYKIRKYGLE